MTYKTWDTVAVPFPFSDKNATKKRPALVINTPEYQVKTGHLMLLMITSAENSTWYSDINITNLELAGLKNSSVIRFKMFSIDERLILKQIGVLSETDKNIVIKNILNTFELNT